MITIGMLWPLYRLSTQDKRMTVEEGRIFEIAIFPSYAISIVIAIMFFYGFLTYLTFWQKKQIGFHENIWLKWFVGSYLGFVFAFALYIFLVRFQLMDPSYDYLVDFAITAFIAMLAFFVSFNQMFSRVKASMKSYRSLNIGKRGCRLPCHLK